MTWISVLPVFCNLLLLTFKLCTHKTKPSQMSIENLSSLKFIKSLDAVINLLETLLVIAVRESLDIQIIVVLQT